MRPPQPFSPPPQSVAPPCNATHEISNCDNEHCTDTSVATRSGADDGDLRVWHERCLVNLLRMERDSAEEDVYWLKRKLEALDIRANTARRGR